MTVYEWRKKNRRCKFCKHIRYLILPPNCIGESTYCKAKDKFVSDEMPRPFCALFSIEKSGN